MQTFITETCTLILALQASDARLAGLNTLKYSVWFSRGAGLVLGIDGFLILLPGACTASATDALLADCVSSVCRNIIAAIRPHLTCSCRRCHAADA